MPSNTEKQAALDLIYAYKRIFAHADGQAVLRDLIHRFGYCRVSTFVAGQPDLTAFNEGRRSVLMHIGSYVDASPESLERFQAGILNEDEDPSLEN